MRLFRSIIGVSGLTVAAVALLFHIFAIGAAIGLLAILWLFWAEIFCWCCEVCFQLHDAIFGHDNEPL